MPRVIGVLAFAALAAFGLHENRAAGESDTEAEGTYAVATPAADPDPAPDPAAGVPDVERYCELREEFSRAAGEFFREHRDTRGPEAREAGREFLREQTPTLEELKQVAPGAVQDEVITFVQGSRAFFRGTDSGPSPAQGRAAVRRLDAFDRKSCDA